MTTPALMRSAMLICGGAFALAMAPAAVAQGTAEQREACTEDAVRLCPDAIPDVDRTTACMKAHEAQLTRRCHRVFAAEEGLPAGRGEGRRLDRGRDYAPRDLDEPRRAERRAIRPDEGYDGPRGNEDYDSPRRAERLPIAPDDDFDAPRRPVAPYDEDYAPRRAERPPLPGPDEADGYGPRRYLYLTPRGRAAQTPDDAY